MTDRITFHEAIERAPLILGLVHLRPLPGTPLHEEGTLRTTLDAAVADARTLEDGGADGCLVQTVDRVYAPEDACDPARLAAFTLIARAVVEATGPEFLVGLQIMKNAVTPSIAVAKVVGAGFVRVSAFLGVSESQFGTLRGDPDRVIKYRRLIGANSVAIVADVQSQHFTWAGAAAGLHRIARWASEAGAAAVCLGDPDPTKTLELLDEVGGSAPVVLSGHTTPENAGRLLPPSAGAFVGSCLKDGGWETPIVLDRVREYVRAARAGDDG